MSTVAKEKSAPTPRVVIVGFFDVPGYGLDSVETPVAGKPAEQYTRLANAIAKRHPKVDPRIIRRTGSVIEQRDVTSDTVEITPGMTLGQIFPDDIDNRIVGRVFLSGAPYHVNLMFRRAQGVVTLQLKPLLRIDSPISFSNQISAMQLAESLPLVVKNVLGGDAKGLSLNLRAAGEQKEKV